jgi:PAS domain S-box-containing protein
MKNDGKSESEVLRQKAESLLKKKQKKTPSPFSETEMLKLVHELEVHQVELELQNDELCRSRSLAEEATGKYTNLYEFAPSGYFTLSTTSEIIEINITGALMLGRDRSKLINRRFTDFVSPDSVPVFNLFLDQVFQTRCKESGEIKLLTDGDIPAYVLLTGIITDNLEQCNVTMVDITERKLLEDKLLAEKVFRRSIEVSLSSGIAIVDHAGKQIYVNPSFCKLLGWSESELIGQAAPFVYWPAQHLQAIETAFQITLADKAPKEGFELVFMRKDGCLIPVQVVISPFYHGKELIGWLANVIGITERKEAENEIHQLNEALELRIIERTDQLETINRELKFHLSELEQFSYVSNHDLQEPLRTLSQFTQLFTEKYEGKLDDEGEKYLEFISKSAMRMSMLVKDLLEYSLLGKESVPTIVDCNKVVEAVLSDLDDSIKRINAKIAVQKLPALKCYESELRLLFQNLIQNAIKYHKKGMVPEVQISAESHKKEWLFSVRDNGIGIDGKHFEKIFIIFQRLHNRNEYEGTGIGLAHCKKIVEIHGGRIWVESTPGNGSTFKFTIPRR